VQLKTTVFGVLDKVRDESDKDAPVRLVFEPKTSRIEQGQLTSVLLAHTSLESSAPINMTMVGADGRPTQKGLRQILAEWVGFRMQTVQRRTLIQAEKRTVAEVKLVDEPVTVVVSLKGWVRALKGHEIEVGGLAFKAGDGLYGCFPCRTVDTLLIFGSNGRVYSTAVAGLPGGRGDGQPITTLIELESGTQPLHYFAAAPDTTLLLAGTGGFGLLAKVGDMVSRQKGGKAFLSLEADDKLLPPSPVGPSHSQVACLSLSGRLLAFGLSELKLQPKGGRGLTLMDVDAKDPLVSVTSFAASVNVLGTGRGGKPKEELLKGAELSGYVGKRARKGKRVEAGGIKPLRLVAG
jgi:topoisomerase-4 subunit A